MTDSLLVLAAWLALPYGAALVAYLCDDLSRSECKSSELSGSIRTPDTLEHPSGAQNGPVERRTAAL